MLMYNNLTNTLPELKYYPDYILRVYINGTHAWYLIPYEILNSDYLIQLSGYKYIIFDYGIYLYGQRVKMWLRYITNIDDEYYYRRYFLHIIDNRILRCHICGTPKKFINISRGYYRSCTNPYSCIMMSNNLEGLMPKFTISSNINSSYSRFINRGCIDDPCCYYIAWNYRMNRYKIGITSNWIVGRARMYYNDNKNYHILSTGTRLEMAMLERAIKLHFNISREYLELNQMKEFKTIFRLYIKKLNISNSIDRTMFE